MGLRKNERSGDDRRVDWGVKYMHGPEEEHSLEDTMTVFMNKTALTQKKMMWTRKPWPAL